jgi:hypothetical protein
MSACASCERELAATFRYCPWCGTPQRAKVVEFFAGHPLRAADRSRALRVSRYLDAGAADRHVRFSVWRESGEAEAVLSLDDAEADRLAAFLRSTGAPAARRRRPALRRRR